MLTTKFPVHRISFFIMSLNLWTSRLLYRNMATMQSMSISKSLYLSQAHALPFFVKQLPNYFALDIGQDLRMVRVVEVGRLAGYRLACSLCRMCVLCLLKRWCANPHNTTLPLYSNEFYVCYQCCWGKSPSWNWDGQSRQQESDIYTWYMVPSTWLRGRYFLLMTTGVVEVQFYSFNLSWVIHLVWL
jgi:hypothetical protein